MILDVLPHQSLYRSLHPRFAAGFDWLLRFDPKTPDGKYEIAGDDLFALVQSYITASPREKKFETHRQRIDIQYMVYGAEQMFCAQRETLHETEPYDPAKDAIFYADPTDSTALACHAGSFTIFFPHDAHKGSCALDKPTPIKKVVLKVRV